MSCHRRAAGLTLVEALVLVVAFVALLAVMIVLPMLQWSDRRTRPTMICATNLRAMHQAMSIYSVSYRDRFPVAGRATWAGYATGFRDGDRIDPETAILDDNVTASLWMMVREGYMQPDGYLCPSAPHAVEDALLDVNGQPVDVADTRDFADWRNLSYSPINMYHDDVGERWTNHASRYAVLMGDDNASDHPERATADVDHPGQHPANSPNHAWKGQNLLFGDGRVRWHKTPFPRSYSGGQVVGANVHAMLINGEPKPVGLRHDWGDENVHLPLLPIHGNQGASLSGQHLDHSQLPARNEGRARNYTWFMLLIAVAALTLGYLAGRTSRRDAQAARPAPAD